MTKTTNTFMRELRTREEIQAYFRCTSREANQYIKGWLDTGRTICVTCKWGAGYERYRQKTQAELKLDRPPKLGKPVKPVKPPKPPKTVKPPRPAEPPEAPFALHLMQDDAPYKIKRQQIFVCRDPMVAALFGERRAP